MSATAEQLDKLTEAATALKDLGQITLAIQVQEVVSDQYNEIINSKLG